MSFLPPAAPPCLYFPRRRQRLQARVKELEKAKKAFLEGERAKRDKELKEANKGAKVRPAIFCAVFCVFRC